MEATMLPKVGSEVRICINLPDDEGSFEIAGQVMRHIERGFAIEYEKPHPDLCYLIDDAAAVVRIFRQSRFIAVKS